MVAVKVDTLRTDRLVLRRWRDDDRAPFATMNADPVVMRYFPATLSTENKRRVRRRDRRPLRQVRVRAVGRRDHRLWRLRRLRRIMAGHVRSGVHAGDRDWMAVGAAILGTWIRAGSCWRHHARWIRAGWLDRNRVVHFGDQSAIAQGHGEDWDVT